MSSTPVEYLPDLSEYLCQRCKELKAVLVSRKEKFCAKCFIWFMRGKQRKQMQDEKYKVKYGAVADRLGVQKALLPLSFGVSSLVLLDMVASLLQEQNTAHKGKQGFDLVVVHLREGETSRRDHFEKLARRYAPVSIKYLEVDVDDYPWSRRVELNVSAQFDIYADDKEDSTDSILELLESSASRSLKADLKGLVYEQIFATVATQEHCQTLLYGHSMTRLANEVIALAVKGRGSKIHEAVVDHTTTFNKQEINMIFPLRDVLLAEVKAVMMFSEGLSDYVVLPLEHGPRLVKNMTVHDLTTQYFNNLDATGYASTASTVVKTAEKLGVPRSDAIEACMICGAGIHHDPRKWLQTITVNTAAPLLTDEELAYAEKFQAQIQHGVKGTNLTACYGCTVTLAGAGQGFVWPVRATKKEILDEFLISDSSDYED